VSVAGELRNALREVDPTMPLADVATIGQLMRESGAQRRFGALLVAGFAILALGASNSRVMRLVIFGVTATDPVTYVASAGVLLAAILLATVGPARRAARLPPAVVLAGE
ncbi:MAG: hypothetical protein H0T44_04110, partial [Gemmatimonadales bacterium]|nr:hypothetical protein [Gemmatimonadales bacterium]